MKLARIALFVTLLAATGCSAATDDATNTTSSRGRVTSTGADLFAERVIGRNPGCVTCHSLDDGIVLVGPSLANIVSPVPGVSTEEYVRQSIVAPDEYVVDGFVAGQMNSNWDEYLTPEQIESLVAFLAGTP